jgi:hypothetical protein
MQKLDRRAWGAGFCGSWFGIRIGVRANAREALEVLRAALPVGWRYSRTPAVELLFSYVDPGSKTQAGSQRSASLYLGAQRVMRTADRKVLADAFENKLQLTVAETAPRHVFIHAGAVGWRGRAIVIPGFSYSGKSTLTAALVRAGATYYSDEYAVFNGDGKVRPFARPLQIRPANGQPTRKVPVESLGGQAGVKPLPLGLVVETSYQPGCRWRPQSGSTGGGILALMAHAVPIQGRPAWTMTMLSRAVKNSEHLQGARGEADRVAERLLTHFADW